MRGKIWVAPDFNELRDLPSHYRDPFDLLLTAQAIAEDPTYFRR